MPASAKVTRSGINVFKLWLTDRGTFPIVLIASSAAVGAGSMALRYLFTNPDVYFDKERRERVIHHEGDVGAAWRQFRFRMANLARNPINQSRQFDLMFDKPENQAVKR
uniref:NADH-ubiquinone reductase complex 1 MLRQ subunit n=1 Tax=Globisporangium ultimum (strain ATCC 200006 / CBS 805.95 / DAOM BR144) TaxID=431595 RepID=K3WZ77_GLOUD